MLVRDGQIDFGAIFSKLSERGADAGVGLAEKAAAAGVGLAENFSGAAAKIVSKIFAHLQKSLPRDPRKPKIEFFVPGSQKLSFWGREVKIVKNPADGFLRF